MPDRYDLIIKGATCVSHGAQEQADVGVRDGRTVAIGALDISLAGQVIDATGLHLLPGVIDTQVHFREPGLEGKEDLASGSRAAAMGGVTAVFEMPNTNPATTTAAALDDKLARAKGRMWVDHAFYVGASPDNVDELAELEKRPGCAGVKIFMGSSTGTLLVAEDEVLARVLASGERRAAIHSEDEDRLKARKSLARPNEPATHALWRDPETAINATRRLLKLARAAGRKVHVLHVTTGEEMDLLKAARDIATVEVTPQHLSMHGPECYDQLGTMAQMNPPIRGKAEQQALWQAVTDGVVTVVGSDHAPHTLAEKNRPYPESPSGMPGVQTLLPLLLDHVNGGRLSLQRLVELTSYGIYRSFGLDRKGVLEVGFDADYTLINLTAEWIIEKDWLQSKCGWSPFEGRSIVGKPMGTILRGRRIMWEGELLGAPEGRPIPFRNIG